MPPQPDDLQEEEALGKAYDARLMRRLIEYLRPYKWQVAGAISILLAASLLQIVGPWLTQIAIDDAIPNGDGSLLAALAGVYLASVVGGFFLLYVKRWDEGENGHLLKSYLQRLETAFENALMHAQLLDSSIKDGLTGLCNVRHLRQRVTEEISRAGRLKHPLSLLFLDVDHFKKFNDSYGHKAGDTLLKLLAGCMFRSFRTTDLCARYGGEEFCVLMPDTALGDAYQKAERFRAEIEAASFLDEGSGPLGRVTISIGVAEYPRHGDTVEGLLEVADAALYDSKKSRNCVKVGVAPPEFKPPFEATVVRSAGPQAQTGAVKKDSDLAPTGTA